MTAPARNNDFPALDGLRAIACMLVLFTHLGEAGWCRHTTELGTAGVMLFFSLSGFLMGMNYFPGQAHFRYWLAFLIRRFLRVYPAFFVMLILLWAIYKNGGGDLLPFGNRPLASFIAMKKLGRPFWTIPVELKFYFWFAVLIGVASICRFPIRYIIGIGGLLWLYLLQQNMLISVNNRVQFSFESAYFLFFLGGFLASRWPVRYRNENAFACVAWVCILALAGYVYLRLGLQRRTIFPVAEGKLWGHSFLLAPFMTTTVLAFACAKGSIDGIFGNRAMRFLGLISFSVYLCHIYVEALIGPHLRHAAAQMLLLLAIICYVSWLLYLSVERPCNDFGRHVAHRIMRA